MTNVYQLKDMAIAKNIESYFKVNGHRKFSLVGCPHTTAVYIQQRIPSRKLHRLQTTNP